MKTIGITGIDGFLGWHLRCLLLSKPDVKVLGAGEGTFADRPRLQEFVKTADAVVHFAGLNRGDERDVVDTNIRLAEELIAACESSGATPHILFPSSTQIYLGTPYGNSKKACTEKFEAWSTRSGGAFTNIILPNVFGECGKPFYNSVVATFCHQLANNERPEIKQDNAIELVHAQVVSESIYNMIASPRRGQTKIQGRPISVSELLVKLTDMASRYRNQVFPDVDDDFDLRLFDTLISFFFPKHYPVELKLFRDERGRLFEAIKCASGGRSYISNTNPGFTRGNHYHMSIFERFLVVEGQAEVSVRRLFSGDVVKFTVDGRRPAYIDIPTLHTHNIKNVGKGDLLTVFWRNRINDNDDGVDVYAETV